MGPTLADVAGFSEQLFHAALALFGRNAPMAALIASFIESLIGLGVVFPGGTIVVLAGFAARAAGGAGLLEVVAAAAVGMTLGTACDYWLGRLAGRRLVPRRAPWRLACRWRHMLRGGHEFMGRWGWWAILGANLAGPGRSAVAVAAGACGWSFGRFLLGQSIASIVWSLLYVGVGFFAAGETQYAEQVAGSVGIVMLLLVAAAGAIPSVVGAVSRLIFARPVRVRSDHAESPATHA